MTTNDLDSLRTKLGEVADIRAAISLLHWDQQVNMPPKGAEARAQQLATLSTLEHRLFTDVALGALLSEISEGPDTLDKEDARLLRVTAYDYERARKLPDRFVHEVAEAQSRAYEVWVQARKESAWSVFEPHLEKIVELSGRKADYLGFEESPYDALLEEYERGMTTDKVKRVFKQLAEKQSALVQRIVESRNQPDLSWMDAQWPEQAQWDMSLSILKDMGYDFEAGRQDKAVHPFSTSFDIHDVRITTRIDERDPFSSLLASIHEGGHALYSQGHAESDRRTPLAEGASLGMHESQSRMWENVIGRSLPFWGHYTPIMRGLFPAQMKGIEAEQIHAAINRVRPSLIRVEADECTYNLHVILRFEIEVALIEGQIAVADVPALWNEKMKHYLGLDVPGDAQGCLQDIHWSLGAIGYFPTYALGNLYAAQFFQVILKDIPKLWQQIGRGEFAPLLAWLREHIHRHGRGKLPQELLVDITGHPLQVSPYIEYLQTKYSDLYGL